MIQLGLQKLARGAGAGVRHTASGCQRQLTSIAVT